MLKGGLRYQLCRDRMARVRVRTVSRLIQTSRPALLPVYLQRIAPMSPGESVSAKKSAANAYMTWRRQQLGQNILGEVLLGLARS